jgi:hypothetical protein
MNKSILLFFCLIGSLVSLEGQTIPPACNCPVRIVRAQLPTCPPIQPRVYLVWPTSSSTFDDVTLANVEFNFTNTNRLSACTGNLAFTYKCSNFINYIGADLPACYLYSNAPTGSLTFINGLTCHYTNGEYDYSKSSTTCPPACSDADKCIDGLVNYVKDQLGSTTEDCRIWEGPCNDASKIYRNGPVSIGTNNRALSDGNKLTVKGGILTEQVKICQTAWCDYVFEPDYCLRPLPEVESYIRENGHLPGCTPGQVILKDEHISIDKEIRNHQEKIEEIFLHLINLQKQLDQHDSGVEK